jgi:copper oxidase (laccase) domain-containing protein
MFDLPAYILARLERAGIDAAHTGHCTYADETGSFPTAARRIAANRTTAARYPQLF